MKKPSLAAAVLLSAVMLLGGCGNKSDSTSGSGSGHSTASTSSAASSTSPSSPSTSSSAASPTAPCRTAGLKITLGAGEGAAGSSYFPLVMKNVSSRPCRTGGFGGVSLVTKPTGKPIGAPADRSQPGSAKPIVLQPGQSATATIQLTNAENFPTSKCMPTKAAGFRVYPPNETHSAFVAHKTTACGSAKVHLLSLRPYRAG